MPADLERVWVACTAGPSLVHGDIRPDDLLIRDSDDALMVVDWAQPSIGAAWQDVVDLIPHMIMAGHAPLDAEKTLVGVPAWHDLPGLSDGHLMPGGQAWLGADRSRPPWMSGMRRR
ncbi:MULTISPECIES: phosphotransferase [Streptosporangium]|uniref:Ser/Thr protein kinase RdoA (MazF antagonist) n=1 Tax=Streptosporangium brasiliense TaxID=47480 RepID=A0ABT9RI96_9ACTN|nr:phosphotransferase [Streptosporangium brasiliense]MDP9869011.1 Ser/Thr protein kinase RdoA (MazF antagonist) [Streptosporangium brasiliense]